MMVADDLRTGLAFTRAVTVMELKRPGFPAIDQIQKIVCQALTIVIAGNGNQLAALADARQELLQLGGFRTVVHQVSDDHQPPRAIVIQ